MRHVTYEHDWKVVRSAETDAIWFVATELDMKTRFAEGSSQARSADYHRCASALREAARCGDEEALRAALRASVGLLGNRITLGLKAALTALRGLLAAVRMIVSEPTVSDPEVVLTRAVRLRSDLLSDTVTERSVLSLTAASTAPPPDPASTGSQRASLPRAA
jgi:hypothetical protein